MSGRPEAIDTQRLRRLQAFLLQDPQNWMLRADFFDTALDCGGLDAARVQIEQADIERPNDPAWLYRKAMLCMALGEYSNAKEMLFKLFADFPNDAVIRRNLGLVLYTQKCFVEAAAVLEPLLEGSDESAMQAWGYWLRSMHALSELDVSVQAFIARLKQGTSLSPEIWGVASLIASDSSLLDQAKNWSEYALSKIPKQLEALVARGAIALSEHDPAVAVKMFSEAVGVNPRDGRSWSGLSFAHMLAGELSSALDAFEQAVAFMPEHLGTWVGYGWCYFFANDFPAARRVLEQAIEQDRNFAESHGSLAVVLVKMGEREQALHEIKLALKLNPLCLSAQYANEMLDGDVGGLTSFLKFSQRVLAQQPEMAGLHNILSLSEMILQQKGKR